MTNRWMLDFDGVVADLSTAFVASCNDRFGTTYTVEEETSWNWWREQPKEYADYVWKECYGDPDWFLTRVKPYVGAIAALADLATDASLAETAMIVTARANHHAERITQWLDQQDIPILRRIPILMAGKTRKSAICARERLNVVVEDGPHNLQQMNSSRQQLFLVDRPWNRDTLLAKVERVASLADVVDRMAAKVAA